ncbi:trafficking protein particle complex II-specific subunit 120, partial [Klebsiella pneumoniae]|nr:trafficking protein particle complex II-specific subunit 120 [Klebsiella pneumoniae]
MKDVGTFKVAGIRAQLLQRHVDLSLSEKNIEIISTPDVLPLVTVDASTVTQHTLLEGQEKSISLVLRNTSDVPAKI